MPEIIEDRQLANGKMVVNRGTGKGLGTLTIDNGTSRSATVKLVNAEGRLVYEVYVRHGKTATISKIDPASYDLWFCFGRDWDKTERRFTRDRAAGQAEERSEFTEAPRASEIGAGRTEYVHERITLYKVPGGNLRTTDRAPEEFDRLR